MKRPFIIIIGLIILILVLAVAKITVSARISTTGIELGQMQSEISQYETENLILQQKLLTFSSLTTVEKKAEAMGFVKSKTDFFVSAPMRVTMR